MTSPSSIRLSTSADVSAIADVCTRSTRQAYAGLVTQDYISRIVHHWYGSQRLVGELAPSPPAWFGYLVAEHAGRVCGVAGAGMAETPGSWDGICELYALHVDPDVQRIGIGSSMMDVVTRQAEAQGATRVEVAVMPGNAPAVAFYEACGFFPAGSRPVYAPHGPEGGPSDVLVYARNVSLHQA